MGADMWGALGGIIVLGIVAWVLGGFYEWYEYLNRHGRKGS